MEPNQFYTGIVAEIYRHLRSSTFDVAPFARFIATYEEPALELGCGDGDPILDLIEQGLDVDGLDASADMLERCQHAADARGLQVTLFHQLIESMELGKLYGSIFLAGATFNLLPDDETAQRGLDRIAAHLRPGGAALIPLLIPGRTPPHLFGRQREHVAADATVMKFAVLSDEYDESARTHRNYTRYEIWKNGSLIDSVERTWLLHWHTRASFREMAERSGLVVKALLETDAAGQAAGVVDELIDGPGGFTFILTRPT